MTTTTTPPARLPIKYLLAPDGSRFITDDASVKTVLAITGHLETLRDKARLFGHASMFFKSDLLGAYIYAQFDQDHAEEADNGYLACAWDFDKFTRQEVIHAAMELQRIGNASGQIENPQLLDDESPANN